MHPKILTEGTCANDFINIPSYDFYYNCNRKMFKIYCVSKEIFMN